MVPTPVYLVIQKGAISVLEPVRVRESEETRKAANARSFKEIQTQMPHLFCSHRNSKKEVYLNKRMTTFTGVGSLNQDVKVRIFANHAQRDFVGRSRYDKGTYNDPWYHRNTL